MKKATPSTTEKRRISLLRELVNDLAIIAGGLLAAYEIILSRYALLPFSRCSGSAKVHITPSLGVASFFLIAAAISLALIWYAWTHQKAVLTGWLLPVFVIIYYAVSYVVGLHALAFCGGF